MCPLKGERGSEGANMARFSRCYLESYEEMAGVIVACEIWKVRLEEAGKEVSIHTLPYSTGKERATVSFGAYWDGPAIEGWWKECTWESRKYQEELPRDPRRDGKNDSCFRSLGKCDRIIQCKQKEAAEKSTAHTAGAVSRATVEGKKQQNSHSHVKFAI